MAYLLARSYIYKAAVTQLIGHTERKNGVILTLIVESLAEQKFDPGFRVIGEYLSQITRNPLSNFSSASDSTFKVKMTPFFLSAQI